MTFRLEMNYLRQQHRSRLRCSGAVYHEAGVGTGVFVAGNAENVSGAIYKVGGSSGIDLINDASDALASISTAIDQVSGQRATLGALQNRLEYTFQTS